MQQIFIELYRYRQQWSDLDATARQSFVGQLAAALAGVQAQGVEVLGFGVNDPDTDRRAPYDFFSAYRVPRSGVGDAALLREGHQHLRLV